MRICRTYLISFLSVAILALVIFGSVSCNKQEGPVREAVSHKDDYKQAYIYGFPMIAAYKAMYEFNIDKSTSQYKAPFNQIWSDSHTFTPKDTAIVSPNADTPYSVLQADLRAEPLVIRDRRTSSFPAIPRRTRQISRIS